MAIAYIQKNQALKLNGKTYNLVREVNNGTWQLEELNTGFFLIRKVDELLTEFSKGDLEFLIEDGRIRRDTVVDNMVALDLLPDKQRNLVKAKYAYIQALENEYICGCEKTKIEKVIDIVWNELGFPVKKPYWQTVYNWYKRYIEHGKDIRVLQGFHANKGNRIRRYSEKVLQIVDRAVDEVYLTRERKTIQDVLDYAIVLVKRENDLLPDNFHLPLPTRTLIKAAIQNYSQYEICEKRYGSQTARVKYRAVFKNIHADRILERVEIDHSKLDLFVLDEKSGLPLGRPWLTICIDIRSRCILGFYISFVPPGYLTVAKCLKNAFLPKTYISDKYPEIVNDWPCYGVCEILAVDNGPEFHCVSLESVAMSFGINILYTPRKQPWFKGSVERTIKTLNKSISHKIPGTTFSNIIEKDDYDPVKHAVITFPTLIEVVHTWIVDIYHQDIHRTLSCPPISVWREEVSHNQVPLPVSMHELDSLLGNIESRVLTHKGIEMNSLFYNSPELNDFRIQHGEKLDVTVRYDAGDIGHIYVYEPNSNEAVKVPAVNLEYADGISLWQHKLFKKYVNKYMPERKDIEVLAEAKVRITELVEKDFLKRKKKSRARIARYMDIKPKEINTPMVQEELDFNNPICSDRPILKSSIESRKTLDTEFGGDRHE